MCLHQQYISLSKRVVRYARLLAHTCRFEQNRTDIRVASRSSEHTVTRTHTRKTHRHAHTYDGSVKGSDLTTPSIGNKNCCVLLFLFRKSSPLSLLCRFLPYSLLLCLADKQKRILSSLRWLHGGHAGVRQNTSTRSIQ